MTTSRPEPEEEPARDPGDRSSIEAILRTGEVEILGRITDSSNITLLVRCRLDDDELLAVHKPVRGERPLWDFPPGLARREVAAYELDRLLGWDLVPETVLREDGPYGEGSFQRLVDVQDDAHYFTLRDEQRWEPRLRQFAAFDVVANNADRKSGHVLLAEGSLWAIDHGLTFHEEEKLRTVIWDYAGHPLDEQVARDLERLEGRLHADGMPESLAALLDHEEQDALVHRLRSLLLTRCLPGPASDRPYPWPLV